MPNLRFLPADPPAGNLLLAGANFVHEMRAHHVDVPRREKLWTFRSRSNRAARAQHRYTVI